MRALRAKSAVVIAIHIVIASIVFVKREMLSRCLCDNIAIAFVAAKEGEEHQQRSFLCAVQDKCNSNYHERKEIPTQRAVSDCA